MNLYRKSLARFSALVESLEQIPTIGRKSAQKIAYLLAIENKYLALKLAHCIETSIQHIRTCVVCGSVSENEICEICLDESRDDTKLCVVLHPKDIFTIEEMGDFNGKYWVLSPELEQIDFAQVRTRIASKHIQEVIFAFSPSLANEAVMLFIEDKLQDLSLSFSKIAQGVPTGIGLENIDQLSLSRALSARVKL
ncbi:MULTISPECIES: recombination mediator RecR [Helicobacter]|uniref:Recombination protein RecR n=2 Tax=Helicobacter TaxID=209 RepID=A0A377J3R6_9HELI|nr:MULTISPECIES: recombination mediator RecR [Helicobacter]MDL0079522.1 recombination mediator RecR [Helicobacter sp. CPD2-1]MDL0081577.1 recombination mediator RecR [Helicobacter sp. XJK30-2]STO96423.1 recombination protein [Helicobacter canis]